MLSTLIREERILMVNLNKIITCYEIMSHVAQVALLLQNNMLNIHRICIQYDMFFMYTFVNNECYSCLCVYAVYFIYV